MTTPLLDEPLDDIDSEPAQLPSPDMYDPDAPYGRNPRTGKPYKQSPEERAAFGRRMAESRREATRRNGSPIKAPAPKAKGTAKATAPSTGKVDPVKLGADTIITTASMVTMMASRFGLGEAFAYDSLAIQKHGPAVSDALVLAADQVPRLESWLEGLGSMGGPWAVLSMALMPLAGQLLANHKLIRPGMLGSLTRDDLHREVAPEGYASMLAAREAEAARAAQMADDGNPDQA